MEDDLQIRVIGNKGARIHLLWRINIMRVAGRALPYLGARSGILDRAHDYCPAVPLAFPFFADFTSSNLVCSAYLGASQVTPAEQS